MIHGIADLRDRLRVYATLVLAVAQVLVPWLGVAHVLGRMQGAQFQLAKSPVVPADYAFGIWGALYAGALIYAAEQARPSRRADPMLRRIGWPVAIVFLGDAVWSALAQPEAPLGLLALAIVPGLAAALAATARLYLPDPPAGPDRWRVGAPVAGLAGWLTAAFFANISVALPAAWRGAGPAREIAPILLLCACGVLAAVVLWRLRAPVGDLASLAWGLVAIVVADLTREVAVLTAVVAGVWLTALVVLSAFAWNREPAAAARTA